MSDGRTLFQVLAGAGRPGAGVPRHQGRGGLRLHAPSDVTRLLPVWIGAAAAAAFVLLAWRLAPPTPAKAALALPHSRAQIGCDSCHASASPAGACTACHGPHRLRGAHQALADEQRIGCVYCHDVHGDDQGIRFAREGTLRYGVDASRELDARASEPTLTVVLVPLQRCAGCHDLANRADPIARCRSDDLLALGGRAPNLCFDEHRFAPVPEAAAVCRANHAVDRLATWERARVLAHAAPEPVVAIRRGHAAWLLSGCGGGVVGLALGGLLLLVGRRRRERARHAKSSELSLAKPSELRRLPVIDVSTCLGCYACVDACPYDVLSVERYVAVVDRPEACCGLTLCEQVCPNGSLRMGEGTALQERPLLGEGFESQQIAGLYLAGDITGVPLIKNAILQGTTAAEQIHARLPKDHGLPLDLLVIGAGPAGIAAALRAKELGLRFEVIEQGTVAHSIKSFPRGKLVFDQPLELASVGKLWLQESSKEELLEQWLRIVRTQRLPITEHHRFVALHPRDAGFEVQLEAPDGAATPRRAARVLLAIGVRGSPRKLPIDVPERVESKIFYHLADARSFAGQRVLVVGLGDSAMEAAIALAHQPGTEVTVSYRGDTVARGKRRNIDELLRLVQLSRIRIAYRSELTAVSPSEVVVSTPDGDRALANDAVLVMIGSVAPRSLLAALGIGG